MLTRLLKMLAALGTGMGVTLVTQVLLPPAFIRYYGIARYGEWLVLSATVTYLGTLNFGITTYASNELTMMRRRGEHDNYKRLQASTLLLLFCMIGTGITISSLALVVPMGHLLHLTTLGNFEASLVAFFLGLQIVTHMLAGYYNALFMVIEQTHRGTSWYNWRRLAATLVVVPLAMFRCPFSIIAFGQFAVILAVTLWSIVDLRRRMPHLPLGLAGAEWKTAIATLKPSGMFAMIYMQTFMLYQVPLIILQRMLGAETVVVFATSRTIMSTARQLLQTATSAVAPEITFTFGTGDMKKLLAIFHNSEKIVFALIPVANLGVFLFSPLLLHIWLHKPSLYDASVYALMAVISGAISVREHKQFFQFSTNTHENLSYIVFFGNVAMILISIPAIYGFGMQGFLWVWLLSEVFQMLLIYNENRVLFDRDPSISIVPAVKLVGIFALCVPACLALIHFAQGRSLETLSLIGIAGIALLTVQSYYVFGVKDVYALLQKRILHKIA